MIAHDVSFFINTAYALTVLSLGGLALVVAWRAAHWAKRARDLEPSR